MEDHRGQLNPIVVGVLFNNKAELKKACQSLATSENFEFTNIKSDKSRMTIKCITEECSWHLHVSKVSDIYEECFEIKTMHDEHNYLNIQHLDHYQASIIFIAAQIQGKIRDCPSYYSKDIQYDIRREFGIIISYSKTNRAKDMIMMEINDFDEAVYHALSKYCEDLICNNPDSTIVLESTTDEDDPHFQYIFICYNTSVIDFTFYHPVLELDGIHLNIKYKDILLTVIDVDVNDSLFSLTSAVVDAENNDN